MAPETRRNTYAYTTVDVYHYTNITTYAINVLLLTNAPINARLGARTGSTANRKLFAAVFPLFSIVTEEAILGIWEVRSMVR